MIFYTHKAGDEAAGNWKAIQTEAAKHHRAKITVENYSEAKEWSEQQRKWWKGVLLPALAKDTGDSLASWETRLKLAVLPDDFQPEVACIDGIDYTYIPSIAGLSIKKMNLMVEGSVAHLRDENIYGDHFHWVTLPDKELRK